MAALPKLGAKGQGWVIGQFLLAATVVVVSASGPPSGLNPWLAALVIAAGGAIGMWSLLALGSSLTPYPAPRPDGHLVEHGPYRVVRHPVYSSLLLMLLGVCLWGSLWALLPLLVLLLWWLGKADVEEEFLRQAYPDYVQYCRRVPRRIIPWLL